MPLRGTTNNENIFVFFAAKHFQVRDNLNP